jgi:hypothetical protein
MQETPNFRKMLALTVGETMLFQYPGDGSCLYLMRRAWNRAIFPNVVGDLKLKLKREADANVLRGLLALEEGEVVEAQASFGQALALWKDEATAASQGSLDFNGRTVAQDCLGWLDR